MTSILVFYGRMWFLGGGFFKLFPRVTKAANTEAMSRLFLEPNIVE